MQFTTFKFGDRVQLLQSKHEGKVATVKTEMYGKIGSLVGSLVGLELDEPTGDNSGDSYGMQLFECKPMHGLFMLTSEVKLLDIEPNKVDIEERSQLSEVQVRGEER